MYACTAKLVSKMMTLDGNFASFSYVFTRGWNAEPGRERQFFSQFFKVRLLSRSLAFSRSLSVPQVISRSLSRDSLSFSRSPSGSLPLFAHVSSNRRLRACFVGW
jgi:hypothetical protein